MPEPKVTVNTIGYQKTPFESLAAAMADRDLLVDVRSRPYGRAHRFNRGRLEVDFPGRYVWKGDVLGGFGDIDDDSVEELARLAGEKRLLILCFEKDPETCHRHYELARRLRKHGIETVHLVDAERVDARELDPQDEMF